MRISILLNGMGLLLCSVAAHGQNAGDRGVWTNTLGMDFVQISAGTFLMGSNEDSASVRGTFVLSRQRPVHEVHITSPIRFGRFEVTQAQWEAVMGSNPSEYEGADRPVENVSFNDVQDFLLRLNELENTERYRLPTEAEWEYAALAGSKNRFGGTSDLDSLCLYANIADASEREANPKHPGTNRCDDGFAKTSPVGSYRPNGWGLYDMTGNVWEWTRDWYDARYYDYSPADNPTGPASGTHHVKRGGCWHDNDRFQRIAFRIGDAPPYRKGPHLGFRVVAEVR
jgi:formylglycine-generating enzyme required for sulfatase activity